MTVSDLKKHFKMTKAVDEVSFCIDTGQTLGLVGESGCGKTTLARVLMNLEKPTSGNAFMEGESVFSMSRQQISKQMRMIFQNPNAALNPQMKVMDILKEAIAVHRKDIPRKSRIDYAKTLLSEVKFPAGSIDKYPHQLSGGEKRRVAIARALVAHPALIIADEPVSSLDVSIQAQIIDLLINLREEHKSAYLFISHDLSMVKYISHHIAVMFLGRIVEIGDRDEVSNNPLHPYTQILLSAALPIGAKAKSHLKSLAESLNWKLPDELEQNQGCRYLFRCQRYRNLASRDDKFRCREELPELRAARDGVDHLVACHWIHISPQQGRYI
jgi:oligopeptide transport system ATP-binding protein